MAILHNNTPFVIGAKRERIALALNRHTTEDKLSGLRRQYRDRYSFALTFSHNGFKRITFAKEQGYAIGEHVQSQWDEHNLIWSEKLPDGSTAVIVIQHGEIFEDKLLKAGEDDPILWASLISTTDDHYVIRHYGDLPHSLEGMRENKNIKFISSDHSLLDGINVESRFQFKILSDAFADAAPKSQSTVLLVVIGVVLSVTAYGFYAYSAAKAKKQEEQVVDNFLGYRNALMAPSASSNLVEISRTMEALLFIPGWNLTKCTFSASSLSCELSPTQSSQSADLNSITDILGRSYYVDYTQGIANITVALEPSPAIRPYLIANAKNTFERFRDLLGELASPDSITVKANENQQFWTVRLITVSKKGTHLYTLISLADAASKKPILLDQATIVRAGIGFEIDADFRILGAM